MILVWRGIGRLGPALLGIVMIAWAISQASRAPVRPDLSDAPVYRSHEVIQPLPAPDKRIVVTDVWVDASFLCDEDSHRYGYALGYTDASGRVVGLIYRFHDREHAIEAASRSRLSEDGTLVGPLTIRGLARDWSNDEQAYALSADLPRDRWIIEECHPRSNEVVTVVILGLAFIGVSAASIVRLSPKGRALDRVTRDL